MTEIVPTLALTFGSVLYMREYAWHDERPHYFVVLNDATDSDTPILLVSATSQIEKQLEWAAARDVPLNTFIRIGQRQFPQLKRPG